MTSLFEFNKRPDPYAVMGNPISHSKSPRIHQLFARQTGQSISYQAIQVDPGGFAQAIGNFIANGGKGLNITVPFKEEAWRLVDRRNPRAEMAAAVNTIIVGDGNELIGDNTDGVGLVRDLENNHQVKLIGKSVLLIGAGGAARGVVQPLLGSGVDRIRVVNRTANRAYALAEHFTPLGNISAAGFADIGTDPFDILINASASSLNGEIPAIAASVIHADTCCYDMMYAKTPTPFLRWANQHGAAHCIDGLGMLVEQAAESFFLWRGVRPNTQAVILELASTL